MVYAAAAKSLQSCLTVRSHRWQPTRLPHPWESLGKNTGVGCHFLLQCMTVKSESEVAQLCPTLRDPMDCSPPGSSICRIFQARVLEWGAIAFSIKLFSGTLRNYPVHRLYQFLLPIEIGAWVPPLLIDPRLSTTDLANLMKEKQFSL